jgi:serine protease Do
VKGARAAAVLVALAALGVACGRPAPAASDGGGASIPPGATSVEVIVPPAPTAAPPVAPTSTEALNANLPPSFAPIARAADPAVVTITTEGEELEASPFSRRVRKRKLEGLGTGFLIRKDGVILTNNHVIESASTIAVKLSDERTFPAKVVGRDPATDIAVVRIEATDLTPLALGDSDAIQIGDWVVAIGNPFGLDHTVSAGIVSAKGRTRKDVPLDPAGYYDFLQTDASINPGNSGGPLLNLRGEVVGINSAIRGGGAQGIGFAIPINMVKQLLPMLLRDGHVTRSALGVIIRDLKELPLEDRVALKLSDEKGAPLVREGAVVEAVNPGGPADKAGIAPGDVIVAFEDQPIHRSAELQWLASTRGVGKQANLRVARDGKEFTLKVTLGQLPEAPRQEQP